MWDFRELREFIVDTGKYIILIIVVFLLFMYVISMQEIIGNSMSPNLKQKEIVFVNKLKPTLFNLERFDIVSLTSPDGKVYVKRIIGLPGDTIHYLKNTLYINDIATPEPFLNNTTTNSFFLSDVCSEELCPDGIIPKDYYLVLGDNRIDSLDSRDPSLGLVPKKNIIGEIILRIYPFNRISTI